MIIRSDCESLPKPTPSPYTRVLVPFSVSAFNCRSVVCTCSEGAVGSFSNKITFAKTRKKPRDRERARTALACHYSRLRVAVVPSCRLGLHRPKNRGCEPFPGPILAHKPRSLSVHIFEISLINQTLLSLSASGSFGYPRLRGELSCCIVQSSQESQSSVTELLQALVGTWRKQITVSESK